MNKIIIDTVWLFNTGQDNRKSPVRWDFANGDRNRLKKVTA